MSVPYAEVIGDPIAHSRSPAIHKAWLDALAMPGDFRAVRVPPDGLAGYLARRRLDPLWRGCSVTLPHKEAILGVLNDVDPGARAIGAVNCVVPDANGLTGYNSDLDGIAAALDPVELAGRAIVLIGGGGGARAALHYLAGRGAGRIDLLVRNPDRAAHLVGAGVFAVALDRVSEIAPGVAAVINASPLGMAGCAPMPAGLIAHFEADAAGATWFDMVYAPLETAFLAAGRARGATTVDGLTMLVGQARAAFARFFGRPAPADDPARPALPVTA